MQRRMAAKKKGKKLKTMRCHVKDGHLRCQAKKPMTKTDTATFYKTMFGLGEEGTETEPVEDVEEEEILLEVVRAAPEGGQKSVPKNKKESKKKEKKRKSASKETNSKRRRRIQEPAEDHDTEAALDGNGIGDEETARAEDRETQEAAGPALASVSGDNARCAGVEETAPGRPEENEEEAEAKKSAPEEGEEEAAPAPVE